MENIAIGILITLLAIAIIATYEKHKNKKTNKIEELFIQKNTEDKNKDEDETTKLDIYNAIIDLSNQIQIVNIWLFLIFIILFIKLILPSILAAIGIGYVANELNNIF